MRERKWIAALMAACLLLGAGCAARGPVSRGEARILSAGSLEKMTTYRLREAVPTELGHTAGLTVSESWQLIKSVRTGSGELRLKEVCVSRGQRVSKGDPIAVLEGLGSEADVELLKLEIRSAEAGQKEMLAYYESALRAARESSAETEREHALRVEYAGLELEKYRLQSDYYLSSLYDRLASLEATVGEIVVTAPAEGSIHSLTTRFAPGDLVPAGTELCTVWADEGRRFYGTSSSGSFVYGREVSIRLSKGSRKETVTGRVVSSPEVASALFPTNVVLLELDPEAGELLNTEGEASVSYTLLSGVFTVPASCIKTRDGVSYVELLSGDTVRSRNVVRGPSAGGYVAILRGLQEGDQVVLSSYNS